MPTPLVLPPADRAPVMARLLRWLGPWVPPTAVPRDVRSWHWLVREGAVTGHRAWVRGSPAGAELAPGQRARLDATVYEPASGRAVATWLIAPGLHFLGPDDPRFDRFCRQLAAAGFRVIAPFLPDYLELRVRPTAADDLEAVARAALERFDCHGRLALFSISFGSLPALAVAARLGSAVDGVVTFGGTTDFETVVRFCLTGVAEGPAGTLQLANDPLNPPALFLNFVDDLEAPDDREALRRALTLLCYRTWGRMELKAPGRLTPFVEPLAAALPPAQRERFRVMVGARPGGIALLEEGLRCAATRLQPLRAEALLGRSGAPAAGSSGSVPGLSAPVVVCHGRDDDVIPWTEAARVAATCSASAPTRVLLTGLYAHTGAGDPGPGALLGEGQALLSIAGALASAGRLREVIR